LQPLTQLLALKLHGWSSGELPQVLTSLTRLTRLECGPPIGRTSNNAPLPSGCERLAALPGLQHLVLRHCYLTVLPPVLTTLSTLTFLDLKGNPLVGAQGWPALAQLPHLREVCLPHREMAEVPPELTTLHLRGLLKLNLTSAFE